MEKKTAIALLLVLCLAVSLRSLPLAFGVITDPDAFFHARSINNFISEQGVPVFDKLSQQGRLYPNPPLFHLEYALLSLLSGFDSLFLLSLFPLFLAAAMVLIVFVFSRRLFGERIALFSAFLLATMALNIIRTNSVSRPDSFGMLLVLAAIFFFYQKHFKSSAICALAIALTNPVPSLLFLLGFLALFTVAQLATRQKAPILGFALVAGFSLAAFAIWFFHFPNPLGASYSAQALEAAEMQNTTLIWLLSMLSFSWLFLFAGISRLRKNIFLVSWLAFSILFGMVAFRFSIFLALPTAIIGGIGFDFLEKKTRQYKAAFYLLVAALALASLYPFLQLPQGYVNDSEKEAMLWLRYNSPQDANIFSQWDRGDAVAYYSQRAVVVDGHFEFNPSVVERNADVKELILTSDCNKIKAIVDKYKGNYLFVHSDALKSLAFKTGILEAKCPFISTVFENSGAKIIRFG